MYLLNSGKMTKKVANRIDFVSRIMNIGFSKSIRPMEVIERAKIVLLTVSAIYPSFFETLRKKQIKVGERFPN